MVEADEHNWIGHAIIAVSVLYWIRVVMKSSRAEPKEARAIDTVESALGFIGR